MYDLNGKTAIVTGCGSQSGIGRAIALRLAAEGAAVAVTDIAKEQSPSDKNWKGLTELVEKIEAGGGRALAVAADNTDSTAVENMAKEVTEKFGGIDILVNNAGAVFGVNLFYMMNPNDWRRMLDINLTGTFLVSQAVAKSMVKLKRKGSIINIASWRGRYPAAFLSAYCTAKAGVIALTEVMALELSANGVRVNSVCPGKVETDMERMGWRLKSDVSGKTLDDVRKEECGKIPLGRIAQPEDVAKIVAFLASDQSNYMTGQTINFTGGMTLVNAR